MGGNSQSGRRSGVGGAEGTGPGPGRGDVDRACPEPRGTSPEPNHAPIRDVRPSWRPRSFGTWFKPESHGLPASGGEWDAGFSDSSRVHGGPPAGVPPDVSDVLDASITDMGDDPASLKLVIEDLQFSCGIMRLVISTTKRHGHGDGDGNDSAFDLFDDE